MKKRIVSLIILSVVTIGLLVRSAEAQWVQTNGPGNNNGIRSIISNGSILFAGTYGGGVFRSMDSGTSWTAVNNGLTNDIWCLAVNGSILFAGSYGDGIFRSTDSGTSWTAVNNGLTPTPGMISTIVQCLAVSGSNLFVGTYNGGVFRSTDSGTSWTAVNNGLPNSYISALTVLGSILFAGDNAGNTGPCGVFRSTDSGKSWSAVNNGLSTPYIAYLAINGSNLFAGTSNGGVFRSTDSGTSWTAVNSGLPADINSLAMCGRNVFAGSYYSGDGVFRSTDSGTNWTAVNAGLTNMSVYALTVSGNNVFAGTDDGFVWRWSPKTLFIVPCSPNPTSNRRPKFKWYKNDSISVFQVQIDTTRQFSSPIVSVRGVPDTTFTPSSDLPLDTIYWRVSGNADTSIWSTVSSVRIVRAIPILIPCSPNPTSNRRPKFKWYKNDSISVFQIQLDTTMQFSSPTVSVRGVPDTTFTPSSDLPLDTIYWRVSDNADTSIWSTVSSVKIVHPEPTDVLPSILTSLPRFFSITGSSQTVRYSLPVQCYVSLRYYDLKGRQVASLVNNTQSPGNYTLSVKHALPAHGSYIRIFKAGSFIKREITTMMGD